MSSSLAPSERRKTKWLSVRDYIKDRRTWSGSLISADWMSIIIRHQSEIGQSKRSHSKVYVHTCTHETCGPCAERCIMNDSIVKDCISIPRTVSDQKTTTFALLSTAFHTNLFNTTCRPASRLLTRFLSRPSFLSPSSLAKWVELWYRLYRRCPDGDGGLLFL